MAKAQTCSRTLAIGVTTALGLFFGGGYASANETRLFTQNSPVSSVSEKEIVKTLKCALELRKTQFPTKSQASVCTAFNGAVKSVAAKLLARSGTSAPDSVELERTKGALHAYFVNRFADQMRLPEKVKLEKLNSVEARLLLSAEKREALLNADLTYALKSIQRQDSLVFAKIQFFPELDTKADEDDMFTFVMVLTPKGLAVVSLLVSNINLTEVMADSVSGARRIDTLIKDMLDRGSISAEQIKDFAP